MKTKRICVLLLTLFALFVIVTVLVLTENAWVANMNHAFYTAIATRIHPTLTMIATWVGHLTHWYSYTPILLLLLILPRTRMKAGLTLAATLSASAILGPLVLKNIFAIERPDINQLIAPGGFGYPSGHSMNAAVFFGMCAIMVLRYAKNKPLKIGFTIFAILAVLLVGLSRIYLGVHTVTDVVGGYAIGGVVICAAILIEAHIRRKAVRKSEVPSDK